MTTHGILIPIWWFAQAERPDFQTFIVAKPLTWVVLTKSPLARLPEKWPNGSHNKLPTTGRRFRNDQRTSGERRRRVISEAECRLQIEDLKVKVRIWDFSILPIVIPSSICNLHSDILRLSSGGETPACFRRNFGQHRVFEHLQCILHFGIYIAVYFWQLQYNHPFVSAATFMPLRM